MAGSNLKCNTQTKGEGKHMGGRASGIDEFWAMLRHYRKLILYAFGSAALPLAAFVFSLAPPWPAGIVVVTSVIELVAVVVGFQLLQRSSRHTVNMVIKIATAVIVFALLAYLATFSLLTYQLPWSEDHFFTERSVAGLQCKENVRSLFPTECPFLDVSALKEFEYKAEVVWTHLSITGARLILLFFWFGVFFALPFLLSGFLTFQNRRPAQT